MKAKRHAETVYLNVYEVSSVNSVLEWIGFGLYHTSVGMYNLEFSFGGHNEPVSGTVVVLKGDSAGLKLKE